MLLEIEQRKKIERQLLKYQKDLQLMIQQRDMLLKEVHHRVKKNLQVISSLLNLQVEHTYDKNTKDLLVQCERRLFSITLIHQLLFQRLQGRKCHPEPNRKPDPEIHCVTHDRSYKGNTRRYQ